MYGIVFSGRLLEGYAPDQVRSAVAKRLGLTPPQVERLFSGSKVVLKKGVTEESAKLYLGVLRGLGMNAGMSRMDRGAESVQALATFKVVFWGRTLEGFSREAVMQAAATRLKLNPVQLARVFDGSKVVLKRSVAADVGSRYVVELARIGMQIDLEVETETVQAAPAPVAKPVKAAPVDPYAGLLQTQFELPGTIDTAETFAVPSAAPVAPVMRQVLQPVRAANPIAVPQAAAPQMKEYVRCSQCGSRQPSSTRCSVCGVSMERRNTERRQVQAPMDASAYATPTTVMGNMPAGLVRNSAAAAVRRRAPSLRDEFRRQPPVSAATRKHFLDEQKSKMLALASLLVCVIWLAW